MRGGGNSEHSFSRREKGRREGEEKSLAASHREQSRRLRKSHPPFRRKPLHVYPRYLYICTNRVSPALAPIYQFFTRAAGDVSLRAVVTAIAIVFRWRIYSPCETQAVEFRTHGETRPDGRRAASFVVHRSLACRQIGRLETTARDQETPVTVRKHGVLYTRVCHPCARGYSRHTLCAKIVL